MFVLTLINTYNTMEEYTKEFIQEKLRTDIRWMERAVLVLYSKQTKEEQKVNDTIQNNGVGFNGTDGRYLSWVATYLQKGNHLSGHHIQKVSNKIQKYWKQIQVAIEEHEQQ
jgi:hypothetical protein